MQWRSRTILRMSHIRPNASPEFPAKPALVSVPCINNQGHCLTTGAPARSQTHPTIRSSGSSCSSALAPLLRPRTAAASWVGGRARGGHHRHLLCCGWSALCC